MMIKHNVLMTTEEYFAVKNYLIELKKQGKFNNDVFMQKFYNAFVIESSIKIDRAQKIFDNPEVDRSDYMFEVGCVVRVIDKEAFYYKAIGRIESIDPTQEYAYFVVFEMIDEITGEIEVYEDCYYKENQIQLFKGDE